MIANPIRLMIEIAAPLEKTWGRMRIIAIPPSQGRARVMTLTNPSSCVTVTHEALWSEHQDQDQQEIGDDRRDLRDRGHPQIPSE